MEISFKQQNAISWHSYAIFIAHLPRMQHTCDQMQLHRNNSDTQQQQQKSLCKFCVNRVLS